jgi:hypothetical protein
MGMSKDRVNINNEVYSLVNSLYQMTSDILAICKRNFLKYREDNEIAEGELLPPVVVKEIISTVYEDHFDAVVHKSHKIGSSMIKRIGVSHSLTIWDLTKRELALKKNMLQGVPIMVDPLDTYFSKFRNNVDKDGQ